MKPSALAVVLACALAFVPTGASGGAATTADGFLAVSALTIGDRSVAAIGIASSDPVAAVTLSVPAGYTVALGQAPGTRVGFVFAGLSEVAGGSSSSADGDLVVDDPARYASDPVALACAPGSHAAVWSTTLSVLGQSFRLLVFVDLVGTDRASGAVLRFCPIWPALAAGGVTAEELSFYLENVFATPTAPGRYTWSALVSPPLGSLQPDPSRTFEVRATDALPHTLTLQARLEAKKKSIVLSGKLTSGSEPEAGVEVSFAALTAWSERAEQFGPVTTNAAGEFSIRRRVEETTGFVATVEGSDGPCREPSTAPGGCVRETVSPPNDASALVRVRQASDPKLTLRARDQAFARKINLELSDFPPGWEAFESFSLFTCPSFRPKLSDLTVTGEYESKAFARDRAGAASRGRVYVTEAQARAAFGREATIGLARCIANEIRRDGIEIHQLRRIPFKTLGAETRAFRLVYEQDDEIGTFDIVSFRYRRAVVHMWFASVAFPLQIEEVLATKVASRARRG